ncbi:MAG: hypothetical protein JWQ27_561 [Ferruginibacter sp.]|nr:hypothetical protein [Ferruginibacter sp.]
MAKQNFKNHIRFYWPHHFVFYPLIAFLVVLGIRGYFIDDVHYHEWLAVAIFALLLGWLSYMMRQHYALTLQNRMVITEMRLRYYQLTQQRLETFEKELSFGQIAALRFASDEELPALLKRTVAEKLSPTDIKRSIQHWLPDNLRV